MYQWKHPQILGGIEAGWVFWQKTCNICEMGQDRTEVTVDD